MIESTAGNLLAAETEALVNPVNCVGVMGKGLALQFKRAYPGNFEAYANACGNSQLKPGKMLIFETGDLPAKYIINFPTKRHWQNASVMSDIEAGLVDLISQVKRHEIQSIAIPALGAGLGGLNWLDVKQRITAAFDVLPGVRVLLYESEPTLLKDE